MNINLKLYKHFVTLVGLVFYSSFLEKLCYEEIKHKKHQTP
jgi:hypothetical protein